MRTKRKVMAAVLAAGVLGAALTAAGLRHIDDSVAVRKPPVDDGVVGDKKNKWAMAATHNHFGHVHGADTVAMDPVLSTNYDVDVKAPWSASQYDGVQLTADAPDLTSLPQVHAVYIHPSDQPNRFAQYAAMFQADARQASDLYTKLFGRKVRWDERTGADGKSYLDITVVKSTQTAKQLSSASTQFSLIAKELRVRGIASDPTKKYFVWFDGKSSYCGQAELAQDVTRSAYNANERSTIAMIYRPYAVTTVGTGGFCRGRSVGHELGHAFGALQAVAPNDYDGAHCKDSAEDIMCNPGKTRLDTGAGNIDFGRNDYWDPAADPALNSSTKLGWWTVNLSRFLCPSTDCTQPNIPNY